MIGGSGGIGRCVAEMLLERGARVAVTHRTRPSQVGEASYEVDLEDRREVGRVVDQAVADLRGLHTVVHAAGPHVPMVHLSRVDPDAMADQLSADAAGFFAVAHAALPALRASSGSLVAVTTAATTRFPIRDGLSSAPKAAVEAMVRALAVEEGRYGLRVNAVGPGMLTDGMAERLISSGELDDEALEIARGNIPLPARASSQARSSTSTAAGVCDPVVEEVAQRQALARLPRPAVVTEPDVPRR